VGDILNVGRRPHMIPLDVPMAFIEWDIRRDMESLQVVEKPT
jgi:hypothetical protein